MKIYECKCGKVFDYYQSFNGHKTHCKIHMESMGKEVPKSNFCGRKWPSWNKGKKGIYSDEHRRKISEAATGRVASEESRKKMSDSAKRRGLGGYIPGAGKGHRGRYKGYWCDSSFELAFVIYNIEHNISFERNLDRFEYEYEGKKHKYTPDFKKDEKYIEIKGYEKPVDLIKYAQVQNLTVLYKKDIQYMIDYCINKYGKDFINMYEEKRGK